jgi:hypothetical protein
MSEPFLQICNHHSASCGDPPIIAGDDPDLYIGYFENAFGEQWVFTYNRTTKKAELRGGDVEWRKTYEVRNGAVPELVLDTPEIEWLRACWRAAVPKSLASSKDNR